jgi:hypothetical protein
VAAAAMDKSMLGDLDGLPEEDKMRMAAMIDQLQIRDRFVPYERTLNPDVLPVPASVVSVKLKQNAPLLLACNKIWKRELGFVLFYRWFSLFSVKNIASDWHTCAAHCNRSISIGIH